MDRASVFVQLDLVLAKVVKVSQSHAPETVCVYSLRLVVARPALIYWQFLVCLAARRIFVAVPYQRPWLQVYWAVRL